MKQIIFWIETDRSKRTYLFRESLLSQFDEMVIFDDKEKGNFQVLHFVNGDHFHKLWPDNQMVSFYLFASVIL